MASKLFFCTLMLFGLSAVFGKITEDTIENITNQTEALKPLVEGTNATFGELLDAIDETVLTINTTTSEM